VAVWEDGATRVAAHIAEHGRRSESDPVAHAL
jgi:hypothetical protein